MSHVRIEEMLAESGLAREEMADVVDLLLPLEDLVDDAPAPSAELAALLGPERPRPVARVGGRRSAVAGALVLALSGVGATGLSAAANTLPRPLQHQVSQFSQNYLPFDLPEPPAPHRRSQGLPALTPAPTGERGGADLAVDPGPPARPCGHRSACADGARPALADRPGHLVLHGPAQRRARLCHRVGRSDVRRCSPSPRPRRVRRAARTTVPGRGHPSPDPGQDDKGKGHGTAPGQGHRPGHRPGQQARPGQRRASPTPSPDLPAPPSTPTPPVPADPQPDPPTPTLPLPDPLPGIELPGVDGLTGQN